MGGWRVVGKGRREQVCCLDGQGVGKRLAEHTRPAQQINWEQSAEAIHNWIRGNDKVPGAWTEACGQVCLYLARIGLDTLVCPAIKICLNWLSKSHCLDPQTHPSAPSHLSPSPRTIRSVHHLVAKG